MIEPVDEQLSDELVGTDQMSEEQQIPNVSTTIEPNNTAINEPVGDAYANADVDAQEHEIESSPELINRSRPLSASTSSISGIKTKLVETITSNDLQQDTGDLTTTDVSPIEVRSRSRPLSSSSSPKSDSLSKTVTTQSRPTSSPHTQLQYTDDLSNDDVMPAVHSLVMMDADDGVMAEEEMVEVIENVGVTEPIQHADVQHETVAAKNARVDVTSTAEESHLNVDASDPAEQPNVSITSDLSRPITARLHSARLKTPVISRPVTARITADSTSSSVNLLLAQSLSRSCNALLTQALNRLASVRAELKFPGLSVSQSACLFVSLALHAERAGPESEAEKQLQHFIETCLLVKQLKQRGVFTVDEGVENEDSRMIEQFAASCEAVGDGAAEFEIMDKYFQQSYFNAQVCK